LPPAGSITGTKHPMSDLKQTDRQTLAIKTATVSAIRSPVSPLTIFLCGVSLLLFGLSQTGCQNNAAGQKSSAFKIVATTGHINDAVTAITEGTDVQIKLLCGPGVDPHSFSASTKDSIAMENADAIIYNGFHLEAKLHTLLHETFKDKSLGMNQWFPEDQRLQWVEDGKVDPEAPFDPHIWNHLPGWSKCVQGFGEKLAELDAEGAEAYKERSSA